MRFEEDLEFDEFKLVSKELLPLLLFSMYIFPFYRMITNLKTENTQLIESTGVTKFDHLLISSNLLSYLLTFVLTSYLLSRLYHITHFSLLLLYPLSVEPWLLMYPSLFWYFIGGLIYPCPPSLLKSVSEKLIYGRG